MRVYVGAKFEDAPRARALMTRLEENGHVITYDWTKHEPSTPKDMLYQCAVNDLEGVVSCDVFMLLWHPALKGGLVELGAALALRKGVIVIGAPHPNDQPCVFFHDPSILFDESVDVTLQRRLEGPKCAARWGTDCSCTKKRWHEGWHEDRRDGRIYGSVSQAFLADIENVGRAGITASGNYPNAAGNCAVCDGGLEVGGPPRAEYWCKSCRIGYHRAGHV